MNRIATRALFSAALLLTIRSPLPAETAAPSVVGDRIARDAQRLSSDELGGRGLGSPGLERAAQLIRQRFSELGLKTDLFDGDAYQRFEVTTSSKLGENNHAAIVSVSNSGEPSLADLNVGEDYTPLAVGGAGEFSLPILFAGYGITAPEAKYDDYQDVNATGKAVVIMRHEPQQANPHSAFNGSDHSKHAPFRAKISNAVQHGAAAIIFTTDPHDTDKTAAQWEKRVEVAKEELANATAGTQEKLRKRLERFEQRLAEQRDPLLNFRRAGAASTRDVPVLYLRPSVIDRLLAGAGKPSLREIERQIDKTLKPLSFDLPETQLVGAADVVREKASVANVAGLLPGTGPHKDEVLVIGAHYDHLGRGGAGSAKPGSKEVHNGADDNASGVAALLAVAERLAIRDEPLDRSVLLVAFTGEENGLLGSAHYAANPLLPLDSTVAMLNFDMVGRMRDNELIVNGVGTATEFEAVVNRANDQHGFSLSTTPGGFGPSDHASFYAKKVPVLHFFTGLHDEYHKPGDDFNLLNLEGIRRVSAMATDVVERLADGDATITYAEVEGPSLPQRKTDPRPYFGSIPDFASGGGGYAISGVAGGSPADEGGLQGGDKIVRLGEYKIGNLEDFDNALRKFVAGDKVKVVVDRAGVEVPLEVVLDPPR